jgi:hypothetical protein
MTDIFSLVATASWIFCYRTFTGLTIMVMGVQVTRTGLYSQEDDLAGMAELNSDDAQEPEWAPTAEPDSPGSYGEPGEPVGSKKLQPSKKRVKGMLRNS